MTRESQSQTRQGSDCYTSQSQLGRSRLGMRLVKIMSASVGISVVTRESYTIMCDTDKMCGTAEISTQSHFGLL